MNKAPIPTKYNGIHFRSGTEARWALFFDALGIKYVYELDGYVLSNGTGYRPDFKLLDFSAEWAEVKPDGDPFLKARQFSLDHKTSIWLCGGYPQHGYGPIIKDGLSIGVPEIPREIYERAVAVVKSHAFWEPGRVDGETLTTEEQLGRDAKERLDRLDVHAAAASRRKQKKRPPGL